MWNLPYSWLSFIQLWEYVWIDRRFDTIHDILQSLGLTRKSKCATLARAGNKIKFFVPANRIYGMTLSWTNGLSYFTCKCSDPFEGSVEWDFDFGKVLDSVVADFKQVGQPQIRQPNGIVIQISLRNSPVLLPRPNQPWIFPRLNIHIMKNINYKIETRISYSLSRGYNIVDWLKFLEFCLAMGISGMMFSTRRFPMRKICAFRRLRRDRASLGDLRMSVIVSKCLAAVFSYPKLKLEYLSNHAYSNNPKN